MRALCVMSHEVPLGPGQYKPYENGVVYDVTADQLKGIFFLELREPGREAPSERLSPSLQDETVEERPDPPPDLQQPKTDEPPSAEDSPATTKAGDPATKRRR